MPRLHLEHWRGAMCHVAPNGGGARGGGGRMHPGACSRQRKRTGDNYKTLEHVSRTIYALLSSFLRFWGRT